MWLISFSPQEAVPWRKGLVDADRNGLKLSCGLVSPFGTFFILACKTSNGNNSTFYFLLLLEIQR